MNPPCASSEDGHTNFHSNSMTAALDMLNSYGIHDGTPVIVAQDSVPVLRCHACKLSPDPLVQELCCHLCVLTWYLVATDIWHCSVWSCS